MAMKTILIIEDEQRLARNIGQTLTDEGYRTTLAFDGQLGLQQALAGNFDLIILDINLPNLNGLEICRQLRMSHAQLPIIMLTALGEIDDKVAGLQRGADDYMVKPFDLRELLARVAACLRRTTLLPAPQPDDILCVADLELNRTTHRVRRGGTVINLTAKEFALLDYLMQNTGRVLSKKDLTERIWQLHFDPGTNVVEVYINYLRKKVDKDFAIKLIQTRPGLGYLLEPA